jgi:hypothetical protein
VSDNSIGNSKEACANFPTRIVLDRLSDVADAKKYVCVSLMTRGATAMKLEQITFHVGVSRTAWAMSLMARAARG